MVSFYNTTSNTDMTPTNYTEYDESNYTEYDEYFIANDPKEFQYFEGIKMYDAWEEAKHHVRCKRKSKALNKCEIIIFKDIKKPP